MTTFYASILLMELLLGADAGGTSSHAVLTTVDGQVCGRGAAGPGNPALHRQTAAISIGTAIRAALGDHDPQDVAAVVTGVAGISGLADPAVAEAFDREWKSIGLTCPVHIVGDAVTAFAAGTTARHGAVLIAGTGSVAAVVDGLDITRTAGGHGWLLGDEGSGTWLGLQAVRAAVRKPSSLRDAIFTATRTTTTDALVAWANASPPAAFAALSPTVCAATDDAARQIHAEATVRLITTLDDLDHQAGPVVLAGSLLTHDTPVRAGVIAHLQARGIQPSTATHPATGAARLAAFHRNPQPSAPTSGSGA